MLSWAVCRVPLSGCHFTVTLAWVPCSCLCLWLLGCACVPVIPGQAQGAFAGSKTPLAPDKGDSELQSEGAVQSPTVTSDSSRTGKGEERTVSETWGILLQDIIQASILLSSLTFSAQSCADPGALDQIRALYHLAITAFDTEPTSSYLFG